MNTHLHIYDTPEATARAVADFILIEAEKKLKQSLPFNVAVSGGNTPKLLFQILAKEYLDRMPWQVMRLFWVDERCVPITDEESNVGMTYKALINKVPIPHENIFKIIGDSHPQREALRYEKLLNFSLPQTNGIPRFDLTLLGMGDDGHTASIFPDNLSLLDTEANVAVAVHPSTGQHRITLTGTVINAAKEKIFFITGASKASILREIINKEKGYKKYPSSFIQSPLFYLDKAAAAELAE